MRINGLKAMVEQKTEVEPREELRDGMHITWHAPIEMDDGIILRAATNGLKLVCLTQRVLLLV